MIAISPFAGIGGGDLALERAGIVVAAQIEIDPFCNRVLARRFPHAARYPDVRTYDARGFRADVVCGGSPCQDVSVAGRREGLGGERSGLFHELVRIYDESGAPWLLFENVRGLLSSNGGADFAVVLGAITGYRPSVPRGGWRSGGVCVGPRRGAAWRLFDAQYFGLAQRRLRLFLVAHPRVERAVAVLYESTGGQGHPAPRDEAGAISSGEIARSLGSVGGGGDVGANKGTLVVVPRVAAALRAEGHDASEDGTGRQPALVVEAYRMQDFAYYVHEQRATSTLKARDYKDATDLVVEQPHIAATLTASGGPSEKTSPSRMGDEDSNLIVTGETRVRRLTITERERLQGFPDGWTCECDAEPYSSSACRCPDGPRARALGNAMPVNVVEWIARRIVDANA